MTLREYVTARIQAIIDAGHAVDLTLAWPPNTPGLGKSDSHTVEQLDAILAACDTVETARLMPFGPFTDPRREAASERSGDNSQAFIVRTSQPPDEGESVDAEAVAQLRDAVEDLRPEEHELVSFFARMAHDAHHSISLAGHPTRRRLEIGWALVNISYLSVADACEAIARVSGCDPGTDAGVAVGLLSIEQARMLQQTQPAQQESELIP